MPKKITSGKRDNAGKNNPNYKGGRTERVDIRATKETKEGLVVIKLWTDKTASDLLEEKVANEVKRIQQIADMHT